MTKTDRNAIKPEPDEDYTRDEVWPIRTIWDNEPEIHNYVTFRTFENYALPSHREKNDFPEPSDMVGRYAFFDPNMVLKWFGLWKKANKRLKVSAGLSKAYADKKLEENRAQR